MQPDCEPKPRSRKLAGRTQIEADRKRLRAASGHGRPESSSGPPRTRDAARPWRSVSRKAHTKRARRSADTSSSTRSVTSTGQCAAAAGRPELDAGLPRLAPTAGLPGVALSGLPRPRLACVPGTTFPLHGVSPLWSCTGKKATRNCCICQQYCGLRWNIDPHLTEQGPLQSRCGVVSVVAVRRAPRCPEPVAPGAVARWWPETNIALFTWRAV